ncbi:MAG: biopolymer transporter ExbD [Cyanobacteria bacterium SID2]|nr:biopolymer transporter ExbD [Cyanobacteria bacterium SID2]MBP0004616.1 biopolymer transporter ExbD [Cyanobacteria bacterium SBC]
MADRLETSGLFGCPIFLGFVGYFLFLHVLYSFAMKLHFDTPNDDVRIEIVPLIDVIFCILTFFILGAVGLSRQQAISQNLPQASTGEAQALERVQVRIDAWGRISVDGDPVTFDELPQRLEAYLRRKPNGSIVVDGDPLARYDRVLQVFDVLRTVGGTRVSLGIRPSQIDPVERNRRNNPFDREIPGSPAPSPGVFPFPTAPETNGGAPLDRTPSDGESIVPEELDDGTFDRESSDEDFNGESIVPDEP